MKPEDFDGESDAFHIDCSECGADAHLISWKSGAEPQTCPYCNATENVDFWDVSDPPSY